MRSSGLSGDEAYLVVRYEYSPGFEELDAVAVGGQGHYWFNDHVELGLTANSNDEGDADSSLNAADLTLRMSSESWVKLQAGRSEGLVSTPLRPTMAASASTATTTCRSPTRTPGRTAPT